MSYSDYAAIPGVNWSTLKAMAASPRHYHHAATTPRPDTPAMKLGRAVHCAVLEPDRLPLDYPVWRAHRRGADWAEFSALYADKDIITEAEYETALAVRDAVRAHPAAAKLLKGGFAEHTVRWTDSATGIDCKARLDYLGPGGMADLKTTKDIDARAFGMTANRLLYHGQMAFYSMGLPVTEHMPVSIIAVESDPPHDVAVYQLSDDDLYLGECIARDLLDKLAECLRADTWPGRYPDAVPLQLPRWAWPDADTEYEIAGLVPVKEKP